MKSNEIISLYGMAPQDLDLLIGSDPKPEILIKLNSDPELFLELVNSRKDELSESSYRQYMKAGAERFGQLRDMYLQKALIAQYVQYMLNSHEEMSIVAGAVRYITQAREGLSRTELIDMLCQASEVCQSRNIPFMGNKAIPAADEHAAFDLIVSLCLQELDNNICTTLPADVRAVLDELLH